MSDTVSSFLATKSSAGKSSCISPKTRFVAQVRHGALYAYPKEKSIRRFMEQVRQRTKRRIPLATQELIKELNPLLRGWGEYYKRAHVRRLFHRLDAWVVHRLWSHRDKRWRTCGWKQLPETLLYGEYKLVNLVGLIPSLVSQNSGSS